MELLLSYGADINQGRVDGMSPLMLATYLCDAEMVALLLARHADVNQTWLFGDVQTPLLWAHNKNYTAITKLIWEHVNRYCIVLSREPSEDVRNIPS